MDGQCEAFDPAVGVLRGCRQSLNWSAAARLEHVFHCGHDQSVMTGVVPEYGSGADTGYLGDLVDRGSETAAGDNLHRSLPYPRLGDLSVLVRQRRRRLGLRVVHSDPVPAS